jgi:hypothetical protein
MESVLRSVRKRKQVRRLGEVEIVRREAYAELELDAKVELIRSLVPLGLMHVEVLPGLRNRANLLKDSGDGKARTRWERVSSS